MYLLSVCIAYLSYDLTLGTCLARQRNSIWLAGYKVIFLVAAVKSLVSYVRLRLNILLDGTRRLQCSALSTTSKGEVLALYREERRAVPENSRALGRAERPPFDPRERHRPASVFWCSLVAFSILYNTAHLALVPLSDTSPLFFGTPAYVLYWGALRTSRVITCSPSRR